jgi:diadenosine tetraphosphatase ApaH/serine/threonine PP2A family protein phosphatase
MCDLVWSDPHDIENWSCASAGAGWFFGSKVTKEFNHVNGLDLIARSHSLEMAGYRYWFPEESLVTVCSVPNYCYRCGNDAAIMEIGANL